MYKFILFALMSIAIKAQTFQQINHFSGTNFQSAKAIGTDKYGNTYVSGEFSGTITIGSNVLTSAGGQDYFVAKYDSTNALIWAFRSGGTGNEAISDIVVLPSGNFLLFGTYTGQTTVSTITNTSSGMEDAFIVRFSNNKVFQGNRFIKGPSSGYFNKAIYDQSLNKIYAVGAFQDSVSLLFTSLKVKSKGMKDVLILTMDTNITQSSIQMTGYGGRNNDEAFDVSESDYLGFSITGSFKDTIASPVFSNIISKGQEDVFVARFSYNATLLVDHFSYGGLGKDVGTGIIYDPNSTLLILGGYYTNSIQMGGNTGTKTSNGGVDGFVCHILSNGAASYPNSFISIGGSGDDYVTKVKSHLVRSYESSNLYGHKVFITGTFNTNFTWNSTVLTASDTNSFIAQYDFFNNQFTNTYPQKLGLTVNGAGTQLINNIAVNKQGFLLLAGSSYNNISIGSTNLINQGSGDGFSCKIRPSALTLYGRMAYTEPICTNTNNVTFRIAELYNTGTNTTYQWYINDIPMPTTTSNQPTTTISTALLHDNDKVYCQVITTNPLLENLNSKTNISIPNASKRITIRNAPPNPIAEIKSYNLPRCNSSDTLKLFTEISNPGSITSGYNWYKNGITIPNSSNKAKLALSGLLDGDVIVVKYSSSECRQTDNDTIVVSTNPLQTPSISISNPIGMGVCEYKNISFTANTIQTGSKPTFIWKVNGLIVGIDSNVFNSVILATNDIVSCTIKLDSTCNTLDSAVSNTVTVNRIANIEPFIHITVNPNDSICESTHPVFYAQTYTGNYPAHNYWYVNNTLVGQNNLIYSPAQSLVNNDLIICTLTLDSNACVSSYLNVSNTVIIKIDSTNIIAPILSLQGDSIFANTNSLLKWYVNGVEIEGLTNSHISPPVIGTYMAVAVNNTCESGLSNPIYIGQVSSIQNNNNELISVYPNPSNGQLFINNINENCKISIRNQLGQLLYNKQVNTSQFLDLSAWTKSLYFIELEYKNQIFITKIVLQ